MLVLLLALLVGPYLLARLANRWTASTFRLAQAGVAGVCMLFCFTGVGHFLLIDEMAAMLPPAVPARRTLVLASGVLEIVAGGAVLVPRLRRGVGWGLILMLLAFLPVNIYAALQRVAMGGHAWGPVYLLVRVPVQLIIVGWIYWFCVRRPTGSAHDTRQGSAA